MAVDFFHRLLVFIAIIAIIIATLFSLVRALLPWLPSHRALIENIISQTIQQPVHIQQLDIGWTQAQPMLRLQHVTISDKQSHKQLLVLPEVDLQLNLIQSLWHKQIQFKRIIFKNAELNLYQDLQQQWHLAGSEAVFDFADQSHSDNAFIAWLLSIEHLQLSQFHIHIQALHWPVFNVQSLSADFKNHADRHRLFSKAVLAGPSQAPIELAVLIKGPAQQLSKLDIDAYAALQDLDLAPWLTQQLQHNWQWQQGNLTAQLWGHWHNNAWQSAQAQLQAKQLHLVETATHTPSSLMAQDFTMHGTWQTPTQWRWQLDSHQGQIQLGTLFRQALPYDRIQAQGAYPSAAELNVPYFAFINHDVKLQAALKVNGLNSDEPVIDLIAGTELLNLNHTSLYLPTGIMPPEVVTWLDRSIKGGSGGQAQMVLRGPIKHFPFHDNSGLMDIRGQLQGIHLNYWPGWPDVTDLNVRAQFTAQGMRIESDHGFNGGIPIEHIEAVIPHYAAPATLQIKATTHSDLEKGVPFLQQSPLQKPLAALANSHSQGPFAFHLNLNIPLSDEGSTQFQGDVRVANAQLSWPDYPVSFNNVQGQVFFSDQEVHSQALQATLWNSLVPVDIQKSANGRLRITGHSDLAIKNLPSQWQYAFAQGHLPYDVTLAVADHDSGQPSEFWVNSTLQGLTLQLPLGFHKAAADSSPVHIHGKLNDTSQLSQVAAQWQLASQAIQANYQRKATGHHWQLTAPLLQGSIYTPQDHSKPWQIHITKLLWQAAPSSPLDDKTTTIDASHWPAMDIRADHVAFGQQSGTLAQLQLRPAATGVSMPVIKWHNDLYQLNASGQWTATQTQFNGLFNTPKIQALLQSFGLPSFIVSNNSQLQFQIEWPGAPWQMDLAKAQGHFVANLKQGSLPSVGSGHATSMGFGKILNLLSLNSLQQHLTLNFQDLTDEGFSFNQLDGRFHLKDGNIKIPDLTIWATLADVKAHGCLNLLQQNYQLALQIEPHLTSSLPVLATLAGGPIIGAIGLVANVIASPTISHITASHYTLTGPWAAPKDVKYPSAQEAAAALHC